MSPDNIWLFSHEKSSYLEISSDRERSEKKEDLTTERSDIPLISAILDLMPHLREPSTEKVEIGLDPPNRSEIVGDEEDFFLLRLYPLPTPVTYYHLSQSLLPLLE